MLVLALVAGALGFVAIDAPSPAGALAYNTTADYTIDNDCDFGVRYVDASATGYPQAQGFLKAAPSSGHTCEVFQVCVGSGPANNYSVPLTCRNQSSGPMSNGQFWSATRTVASETASGGQWTLIATNTSTDCANIYVIEGYTGDGYPNGNVVNQETVDIDTGVPCSYT